MENKNISKIKIAVDIDEVLFELAEGFIIFMGSRGFKQINFEEISTYRFEELYDISLSEAINFFEEYTQTELYFESKIVEGSDVALQKLRSAKIVFITHRPEHTRDKTLKFLQERFGLDDPEIYFTGNLDGLKTKDEICKELGISTIIEDNGEHSLSYAENGLKVLLLDKPWNKEAEHTNIIRCDDWSEVTSKILETYKNG